MTILTQDKQLNKWAIHKKMSARMAERLMAQRSARLRERGRNMSDCAREIKWAICPDCGTAKIFNAYLCRDRLCPTCAWRLSMRRYAEMIKVFENTGIGLDDRKVAMLTLTVKNVDIHRLSRTISAMLSAWSKLTKRRPVQKALLGWARSLEITNKGNGYHPHIHALLVMPPDGFLTQATWAQMWRECMELEYTPITDIRLAYDNYKTVIPSDGENPNIMHIDAHIAVTVEALKADAHLHVDVSSEGVYAKINGAEHSPCSENPNDLDFNRDLDVEETVNPSATAAARAMQYSLKPKVLDGIPDNELLSFAQAVKGRRLTSFGGIIAESRKALKLKDDDIPEDISDIDVPLCPHCGVQCAEVAYAWALDPDSPSYESYAVSKFDEDRAANS